jgi:hypothetical protein
LYKKLQQEAIQKGISINSLVNSIAKTHVNWNKVSEQIGFVPLTKKTTRLLFRNLDDITIKKFGYEIGSTIPREWLFLTHNEITFNNILSVIENSNSRFGMIKHDVSNGNHLITIYHGVSEKFSEFLSEIHKAMAVDLKFEINIVSTEKNFVSFEVSE